MNYDTKIIRDNFINIKNSIKKTINNDQIYNDFLKNVLFYGIVDNKIVLLVNNNFLKSTIENNYKDLFIKTFANTINNKLDIIFLTQEDIITLEEQIKKDNKNADIFLLNNSNTNVALSFENFYVENFNKSAYNAVKSIFNSKKI